MGQFVSFTSIVAGGMFTLGAMLLLLGKGSGNPALEAIVLVLALVLATVAIGLGPGSVPYTLMGELFPPEYRTLGSCVVLVVRSVDSSVSYCATTMIVMVTTIIIISTINRNATVSVLVKVLPYIIDSLGLHAVFIFHGLVDNS